MDTNVIFAILIITGLTILVIVMVMRARKFQKTDTENHDNEVITVSKDITDHSEGPMDYVEGIEDSTKSVLKRITEAFGLSFGVRIFALLDALGIAIQDDIILRMGTKFYGYLTIFVTLIASVKFIKWHYTILKEAKSICSNIKIKPILFWMGWFFPIINLIAPCLITIHLDSKLSKVIKSKKDSNAIIAWWILFLINLVAIIFIRILFFENHDLTKGVMLLISITGLVVLIALWITTKRVIALLSDKIIAAKSGGN